jgi:hypothetical protein
MEEKMPVRLNHGRPVESLFLRHQADHLTGAMPDCHFGDPGKRSDNDDSHALLLRMASIVSKRSQNRRCASTAGSGVISNMSFVIPRGWPKNFFASVDVNPAS